MLIDDDVVDFNTTMLSVLILKLVEVVNIFITHYYYLSNIFSHASFFRKHLLVGDIESLVDKSETSLQSKFIDITFDIHTIEFCSCVFVKFDHDFWFGTVHHDCDVGPLFRDVIYVCDVLGELLYFYPIPSSNTTRRVKQ